MKTTYNFFTGYSRMKFSMNFSWGIFFAVFIIVIIFNWISGLPFLGSVIVTFIIALGITLALAKTKTGEVVTYTINRKEYLLFNPYLYYAKFFKVDSTRPLLINEKKYQPVKIFFIEEFLADFINCAETKCKHRQDYLSAFKAIDIDDIDFFYVSRTEKKEDIEKFLDTLGLMENAEELSTEAYIKVLKMFRSMLLKNHRSLDDSQITLLTHSIQESTAALDASAKRLGYNTDKYRNILNK
jgi:hypothetical protein